jgi:hypothetical protein
MRVNRRHAWLLALSDPDGRRDIPRHPLPADRWADLCEIADYHGVLPAVATNARRAATAHGVDRLIADANAGQTLERTLDEAKRRLIDRASLSLAIRGQIREIATAFRRAGGPVALLKGADFADHLYPDPSLRPFTDLDLLVPQSAMADAEETISRLGYVSREPSMKHAGGYGQRRWVRPNRYEGAVEIHWNLVNSPTIRRGVTLSWEDLAFETDAPDGVIRPTAPARLLIAAVHAAASHGFDRLQPLYDVSLASRHCESPADVRWLWETTRRTGARLPLAASLALCRRLFDEPACSRLQQAMGLHRRGAWSVLLTPGAVLRGHARLDSVRRQIFREMLKRR